MLEAKARRKRSQSGVAFSRREVALEAGHKGIDRRIAEWVPEDETNARVPDRSSGDRLVDVVRVWSRWAGVRFDERYWRTLLDAAQPVRPPRRRTDVEGTGLDDPHGVLRGHEAWTEQYVLPARLYDRDDELRELADFCTAPDTASC
ncbi:hypothetical protein ACWENO_04235 [Streptomyces sp. NPDC004436]